MVDKHTNDNDVGHPDLDFLKKLEQYSFDSKMQICQKYAS